MARRTGRNSSAHYGRANARVQDTVHARDGGPVWYPTAARSGDILDTA
ncbi:hypothetical protein OSI55_16860 [Mycobacterium ulcerans]|uniref:Uncharacterized protein n=1 Tax=Mycobacterium ulcerans str. Harvey TaxID=1299332 RepID=A0ABP3ACI2_MYCUL|nr:hypothetical protein I551_4909 [Mycobacterium ulcerans str. Harvey]MEB3923231.1 hypothetical protein [Mycobacterium ulcerans]MEB3998084.1 hypothetical protein [Mycobacterium ulcerans]MEB4018702.1 hypothetical protein [Mycobacterium ulcerans]MEB4027102.1 hypothetical protein [Mycobacterium ulcerans]